MVHGAHTHTYLLNEVESENKVISSAVAYSATEKHLWFKSILFAIFSLSSRRVCVQPENFYLLTVHLLHVPFISELLLRRAEVDNKRKSSFKPHSKPTFTHRGFKTMNFIKKKGETKKKQMKFEEFAFLPNWSLCGCDGKWIKKTVRGKPPLKL